MVLTTPAQVKKVTKGRSMPTLGERWEVEGFQSVMDDMARVLGETAEQERRAAEGACCYAVSAHILCIALCHGGQRPPFKTV